METVRRGGGGGEADTVGPRGGLSWPSQASAGTVSLLNLDSLALCIRKGTPHSIFSHRYLLLYISKTMLSPSVPETRHQR